MKNMDEAAAADERQVAVDERAMRLAELAALQKMEEVLGGLRPDSAERVLRWYGESRGIGRPAGAQDRDDAIGSPPQRLVPTTRDLPDLFDSANPQTAPDRALVVAYWLQVIQGAEEFDSQRVNTELKNLGFASTNITADFTRLSDRTPSEARQVRKDGRSNQARKKYRLTREGIRRAEAMLAGGETGDQHN